MGAPIAACGSAGPLDRDELVSAGDRVCREAEARVDEIQSEPPGSRAEAAKQSGEIAELLAGEVKDLGDLDAPESLRPRLDRYLTSRRRALALVRLGEGAARHDHPRTYLRAQARFAAGARERRRLARRVGFRVCSRQLPGHGAGGG